MVRRGEVLAVACDWARDYHRQCHSPARRAHILRAIEGLVGRRVWRKGRYVVVLPRRVRAALRKNGGA